MIDQKTFAAESGNHTEQIAPVLSGASPLPWVLHGRSVYSVGYEPWAKYGVRSYLEAEDHPEIKVQPPVVCSTPEPGIYAHHLNEKISRQDAALIVRAVNNHDALVKALEDADNALCFLGVDRELRVRATIAAALNSVRASSVGGALSLQRTFSENPLLKEG